MRSIKLYIELIGKALNGTISNQEASALKALDTLIETEDKLDEGVFDLEHYSWAFGPTTQEALDTAEPDNMAMAEVLTDFRPSDNNPMTRDSMDPIEVINGLQDKSQVMDAMATDNIIEKAAGYYSSLGYLPEDVEKEFMIAMKPLNDLGEVLEEVDTALRNMPAEAPAGIKEEDWITAKGWNDFEEIDTSTSKVIGQWIASLGLPILGSFAGPAGTAAGLVAAPEMPLQETIDLMDDDTQEIIYAGMANNPVLMAVAAALGIKNKKEAKMLEDVIEVSKTKAGQKGLLDQFGKEMAGAPDIETQNAINKKWTGRLKNNPVVNLFNKYSKKIPKMRWIVAGSVAAGALFGMITGDTGAPNLNEPEDIETLPPPVEEETTTTTLPENPATDGFTPSDNTQSEIDEFMTGIGIDPSLSTYDNPTDFTVPEAQRMGDGTAFQGVTYDGSFFTVPDELPSDPYLQPQYLGPGAKVNQNALKTINVGGVQMTMLEFIGLTSKNFDIPVGILYGMINKETGGTFDPNEVNEDDGGPGFDSIGLAQINMAIFGPGTDNPAGHIPGGNTHVTEEMARDPRFAITFLAHNVRRIADNNGGDLIAGVIGHRGGPTQAQYYANNGQFYSDLDRQYVSDIFGTASGFGEDLSNYESMGTDVKREWDPYSPTPNEAVNLYVDNIVEGLLGVKANQEDYDKYGTAFLDAEKDYYTKTQQAKDKGEVYKGLTVGQQLNQNIKETGEYKFVDEKKNYQTVQDWMTKNVLPVLGDLT